MKKLGITILLLCIKLSGFSQATNISPYSRYTLGDLNPVWFAQNSALGGSTVALVDSFQVNVLNPASYSFTAFQSPVFDVSLRARMVNLSTSTASTSGNYGSLNNIALVLPLSRRWGAALGLLPYSYSGYNISFSEENASLGGSVSTYYSGQGNVNRVFAGTSYMLVKRVDPKTKDGHWFSVGGNLSYLFGDLEKTRKLELPTQTGLLNSKIVSSLFTHDVMVDGGLYYRNVFDHGSKVVSAGFSTSFGNNLSVSRSVLAHTVDQFDYLIDTVRYVEDEKGSVYIPARYTFGLTYDLKGKEGSKNNYKLTFTSQYSYQNWSEYKEEFASETFTDTLRNTNGISFGIQFIPHQLSGREARVNVFKLMNYRIGVYSNKNYLNVGTSAINNWGLTAGLGIPLFYSSSSFSMLNISFEYGSRGTTNNNLLMEKYYGIHFGIAFCPNRIIDRWFVKRKYD